jgi:hypothetical protein
VKTGNSRAVVDLASMPFVATVLLTMPALVAAPVSEIPCYKGERRGATEEMPSARTVGGPPMKPLSLVLAALLLAAGCAIKIQGGDRDAGLMDFHECAREVSPFMAIPDFGITRELKLKECMEKNGWAGFGLGPWTWIGPRYAATPLAPGETKLGRIKSDVEACQAELGVSMETEVTERQTVIYRGAPENVARMNACMRSRGQVTRSVK